jgi:hypothetical protein
LESKKAGGLEKSSGLFLFRLSAANLMKTYCFAATRTRDQPTCVTASLLRVLRSER